MIDIVTTISKINICDAYSILLDIYNESKEVIIIIDNYVDKELLENNGIYRKSIWHL